MDKGFSDPKREWRRVKGLLQEGVRNGVFPGAVLRIVKNSRTVFNFATGFSSVFPARRKMTADTIFDIASLTKVIVTTSAVMLLVQERRIKLDEEISAYIPEIVPDDKKHISIRQILSHSAGFTAWKPFFQEIENEEKRTGVRISETEEVRDFFLRGILNEPLAYSPGRKSIYSDLGFILLGFIIERVSGKSLDNFAYHRILNPLRMRSSFFLKNVRGVYKGRRIAATENCPWRHRVICGEVHDENAWILGGVAGHAGLFSTAGDIAIFAREVINSYYGKGKLFREKVAREFFTRQNVPSSSWALGWDTPAPGSSGSGRYFSDQSIGHTGFTGVSLWIDLKRRVAVILLTNRVHPSRDNMKIREFRPVLHDAVMEALGYGD